MPSVVAITTKSVQEVQNYYSMFGSRVCAKPGAGSFRAVVPVLSSVRQNRNFDTQPIIMLWMVRFFIRCFCRWKCL